MIRNLQTKLRHLLRNLKLAYRRECLDMKAFAVMVAGPCSACSTWPQRNPSASEHTSFSNSTAFPYTCRFNGHFANLQVVFTRKSLFATFSRLQTVRREQPNLSNGDTITCFDFDKEDPEVLRYGTSAGLLGRGRFVDPSCRQDRSVDEWEMEHILGAPISSVHMHQGFVVYVLIKRSKTGKLSSSSL